MVVAIPAKNEVDRLPACLAALGMQRDRGGKPVAADAFEVLVFANNCTDETVDCARATAVLLPYRVTVVAQQLAPAQSGAGLARKSAMDLAADLLEKGGQTHGAILTTDADSRVSQTWISATRDALVRGADCVAGYIDAEPGELVRLGPAFLARGRLEDTYLALCAEIDARCDPRPHDPWPNHRVSSGASLAVTLAAYRAIGGLPSLALGEDMALTRRLDAAGFRVRHAMDVAVTTSCRFDGRAIGGAADTMKLRHAVLDAPCDDDLEPAVLTTRRALLRGALRLSRGTGRKAKLAAALGLSPVTLEQMERRLGDSFAACWHEIEAVSPVLARRCPLRPADLPREIRRAERLLRGLRGRAAPAQAVEPIHVVMQPMVGEPARQAGRHEQV